MIDNTITSREVSIFGLKWMLEFYLLPLLFAWCDLRFLDVRKNKRTGSLSAERFLKPDR